MVGTLKKALQEVTRCESKEWNQSLEDALYGYRRKPGTDGVTPFEILYGVKPRFSIEPSLCVPRAEVLSHARPSELAMALINRAERLVPRTVHRDRRYEIGDMVFLRRGSLPVGSKFQACMWLGPYKLISAHHPRYVLENTPGRKSRKPVHVRRLRRYKFRVRQRPGDESSS